MLNKIIKSISVICFSLFNISANSLSPIIVKGEISLVDLYQDILLNLSVDKGLLNEVILLDLSVNNKEVYYQKEYVASYLDNKPIIIEGFSEIGEVKHISINVGYRDMIAKDSNVSFDIYSPNYENYYSNINNLAFKNNNPTKITFTMNGNNPTINYEYESIDFHGNYIMELNDKRVLDFTEFCFKINSNIPYDLNYIELRIYYKFKYSDLYYIDDKYTLIEMPIYLDFNGYYLFDNEINYYINENNGGINISSNEQTNNDLLPFFIPLNVKENIIEYELVLSDIGLNHSSYFYKGIISINESNSFKYELIKDILENVTYE